MMATKERKKSTPTTLVKGDQKRVVYNKDDLVKAKFDGFAVEKAKGGGGGSPSIPTK